MDECNSLYNVACRDFAEHPEDEQKYITLHDMIAQLHDLAAASAELNPKRES